MKGAGWSLLVHGTVMVLLVMHAFKHSGGSEGDIDAKQGQQPPISMDVEIIAPPKTEAEEPSISEKEDEGVADMRHESDDCEHFYGGIGIEIDYRNNYSEMLVEKVMPGYPADLYGVRVGDQILTMEEIKGPVGTPITVRIRRDGQELTFNFIRDKICTTAPKPKGTHP